MEKITKMIQKHVLITGGFGFLGRAVAKSYRRGGWRVTGIGRGRWDAGQARAHGFDAWLDASVSLSSLMTLDDKFDVIVHCAGNGSVAYSVEHPLQDFEKTVQGTAELLDYMRLTKSAAVLVYPSSAGVYGAKPDTPIAEDEAPNPISPYGYTKRMAEQLIECYARSYGIKAAIVRFFSIYGPGLTKQLLWDASGKLLGNAGGTATFWGTGEETRDWITGEDAAALIMTAANAAVERQFLIVNGASGERVTVDAVLQLLHAELGVESTIRFNGQVREGDPRFYHADMGAARALGWRPTITLPQGLREYVQWLKVYREKQID